MSIAIVCYYNISRNNSTLFPKLSATFGWFRCICLISHGRLPSHIRTRPCIIAFKHKQSYTIQFSFFCSLFIIQKSPLFFYLFPLVPPSPRLSLSLRHSAIWKFWVTGRLQTHLLTSICFYLLFTSSEITGSFTSLIVHFFVHIILTAETTQLAGPLERSLVWA